MKEGPVTEKLQCVSESLERIKTHLAWLGLKQSEWRPGDRPILCAADELAAELRNERSHFVATALELRQALDNASGAGMSQTSIARWRRQLRELQAEMQQLGLPKGI